jgi:hypothetical protein
MSEAKKLYQKISLVMQDVAYLNKDDKVEFGNTKYKAISEEKVTQSVRAALIKHGLVILPIEQEHSRDGTLSTVNTKYKIVDIETGDFEIIVSSGTGADTQDKGVGKAMTYSYKYLLLRTFAIPTGEDPDKISSAELDEKQRKEEERKAKEAEADAALYPQLKAKWEILAGSLDGFEDWHGKQKIAGKTNDAMNKYLAQKIMEKKKESA